MHPTIDLTEAAKFYGLRHIPRIVFDSPEDDSYSAVASFTPHGWALHVGSLFDPRENITDSYSEHRYTNAGASPLSRGDAERFILAHELWHAVEWERDFKGTLHETIRENFQSRLGELLGASNDELDGVHDESPLESDADRHAAQAYSLIKIS